MFPEGHRVNCEPQCAQEDPSEKTKPNKTKQNRQTQELVLQECNTVPFHGLLIKNDL